MVGPLWDTGEYNLENTTDMAKIHGLFLTLQVWMQKSKKVLTEAKGFHFGYK